MSLEVLRALDEARVFQPVLAPDALSALHVPFDELTGVPRCEARIGLVSSTPGSILLVGPSGSGKSSAVVYTVAPDAGCFGVQVPVHAYLGDEPVRPLDLASLILDALRRSVGEESIDLGLADPRRSRWRRSATVDLGVVRLGLDEVLGEVPANLRAREEALGRAFAAIRHHGLAPVLVLDDTDKWVAGAHDLPPAVARFFAGPVRWLVELGVSVIVHLQDRHLPAIREAHSWFTEQVSVPELAPPQTREVLLRRADAVIDGGSALFADEALDLVLATVFEDRATVRAAIVLAGNALKETVIAGKDRVDRQSVEAAIADR